MNTKKILATTILAVAASSAAYADDHHGPKVTVGGFFDAQVGLNSQRQSFETGNFADPVHSQTNTELHFKIDGSTESGLKYGAYIELEADVNTDDTTGAATNNNNAERGYVYLETGFGRVELGPNTDAAAALGIYASDIARGSGGIGGDFYDHASLSGQFIIVPGLPTAAYPGDVAAGTNTVRATANKATYYSPRIHGAQIGISYTQDQGERGTNVGFSNNREAGNVNGIKQAVNAGLHYEADFGGINVAAAVVGEFGQAERGVDDDLQAYSFGWTISHAGISLAASYSDIPEYAQVATNNRSAQFFTVGAAYEHGPFGVSVTYLDSEVENGNATAQDNEFQNIVFGADYQLAPGFLPYIEYSYFDTDNNDGTNGNSNQGSVFLAGTTLSF